jgi:hypothetical protein
MKWFLTIISLLAASLFLALESIILLYAINNRHLAYTYVFIGLGSLICVFAARYLNKKNPSQHQGLNILQTFAHAIIFLLLLCGTLVLGINYYLDEGI